MKKLFLNVENKIKFCAAFLAAITIVISVLLGIFSILCVVYALRNPSIVEFLRTPFILGIGLIFFLLMCSWLIYGFAELLENAKEINRTLKAAYAEKPSTDTKQRLQPKQEASIFKDAEKEQARQEKKETQPSEKAKPNAEPLHQSVQTVKAKEPPIVARPETKTQVQRKPDPPINSLAQASEYAKLTDVSVKQEKSAATKNGICYSITNTAKSAITALFLFVLEFDENGQPVSVSPYNSYCINGHQTGKTMKLEPGQTKTFTEELFLQPNTRYVKAIISQVDLQDGTEWVNIYVKQWAEKNCYIYRA